MGLIVYLNGEFLPYERATIPVEDRGFLFADGVYEMARVYNGRPFRLKAHMDRLARSCRELRLPELDLPHLSDVCLDLIARNNLLEATVYLQITRGAYNSRAHAFPGEVRPTILAIARPYSDAPEMRQNGVKAVTVPDPRWARCDIKSLSLLPNVMARQVGAEAGAYEAIFVKDGIAIEGSASNFMGVLDGEIWTYPACNYILRGITRDVVLELAHKLGYTVREEGIPVAALGRCTELWFTSTTAEVMPVVNVDGKTVADGRPGPVALALQSAFQQLIK
jgi:D-alanine transaminase